MEPSVYCVPFYLVHQKIDITHFKILITSLTPVKYSLQWGKKTQHTIMWSSVVYHILQVSMHIKETLEISNMAKMHETDQPVKHGA